MPIQCPYNAHTVPIQCPLKKHTVPIRSLMKKASPNPPSFLNVKYMGTVCFLNGHCMGIVWALYGHCMGIVKKCCAGKVLPTPMIRRCRKQPIFSSDIFSSSALRLMRRLPGHGRTSTSLSRQHNQSSLDIAASNDFSPSKLFLSPCARLPMSPCERTWRVPTTLSAFCWRCVQFLASLSDYDRDARARCVRKRCLSKTRTRETC